ncbi:hypothetical protein AAY473_020089 [Plecturocebus cupreus]
MLGTFTTLWDRHQGMEPPVAQADVSTQRLMSGMETHVLSASGGNTHLRKTGTKRARDTNLHASASQVAGTIVTHHRIQLIFKLFFVETETGYAAQADLNVLGPSDSPTSAGLSKCWYSKSFELHVRLATAAHTCNPSTLGGQGRRMTLVQGENHYSEATPCPRLLFSRGVLLLLPRLDYNDLILAHFYSLHILGSSYSPASAS